MDNQMHSQAIIVSDTVYDDTMGSQRLALFNEAGSAITDLVTIPTGDEVILTGFVAGTAAAVAATDTVNEAVAKLEAQIAAPTYTAIVTDTAIGTAAKTTTSAEPADNTMVLIKFTNGNSAASPTVAFNGGTARAVNLGGSAPGGAEITLAAGGVAMFFFDGTILHQIGVYS